MPAFLEDHACLLNGLMDLIDATTPASLPGSMARKRAIELADAMIKLFGDTKNYGFFFTRDDHEKLFHSHQKWHRQRHSLRRRRGHSSVAAAHPAHFRQG